MNLLCQGLPNKAIGKQLALSDNTVHWHVQAVGCVAGFQPVCGPFLWPGVWAWWPGLIVWGGSFANLTSSLTMLSPFLPAAVASVGIQSISWVPLLLLQADFAAAQGAAMMPLALLLHGRTIAKHTVSAIAFRFENLDLVADLREQGLGVERCFA